MLHRLRLDIHAPAEAGRVFPLPNHWDDAAAGAEVAHRVLSPGGGKIRKQKGVGAEAVLFGGVNAGARRKRLKPVGGCFVRHGMGTPLCSFRAIVYRGNAVRAAPQPAITGSPLRIAENRVRRRRVGGGPPGFENIRCLVLRIRSADRADVVASAAVDAGIRVNYILAIPRADRGNRAFSLACAAADAFVVNCICHWK